MDLIIFIILTVTFLFFINSPSTTGLFKVAYLFLLLTLFIVLLTAVSDESAPNALKDGIKYISGNTIEDKAPNSKINNTLICEPKEIEIAYIYSETCPPCGEISEEINNLDLELIMIAPDTNNKEYAKQKGGKYLTTQYLPVEDIIKKYKVDSTPSFVIIKSGVVQEGSVNSIEELNNLLEK